MKKVLSCKAKNGSRGKGVTAVIAAIALSLVMCMPAMAASTLSTPTVSSVQTSGATAVKVTSNKPLGTAKWDYYCYNSAGKQIKSATNRTSKTYTFTGLVPGTKYSFAVRCKNKTGKTVSKLSAKKNITLPIGTPAVTDASLTSTTATMRTSVIKGAKTYVFRCYNSEGKQVKSGTSASTTYTFTGLSAGTTYKFRVAAKGANKTSSLSATKTLTTPLPPNALKSVLVTSDSAKVTAATTAAQGVQKWTFYCYDSAGKLVTEKTVCANNANFTGLTPATKYSFKVRIRGANQTSGLSAGKTATTSIPAPHLNSVKVSDNTIKVNSSFPKGAVSLSIYCYDGNGKLAASKTGLKQGSYTFTGLKYETKYSIKAVAIGASAKSSYSEATTVWTELDPARSATTDPVEKPTRPTQPETPGTGNEQGGSEVSDGFTIYGVGTGSVMVKANDKKGGYVVCSKTEVSDPGSLLESDGVVADNGTGSATGSGILVTCLDQNADYIVYVSKDKEKWEKLGTIKTLSGTADAAIAEMYGWAKEFGLNGAYYIKGATKDDLTNWWNANVINGDAKYALYSCYKAGAYKASAVSVGSKTLFVLNGAKWADLCEESAANETYAKQANKNAGISSSDSDAVKVTKMMKWLADKTTYTGSSEAGAKGCFTTHNCVCNGYADALNAMCRAEGIPCRLVFGTCDNGSGAESHVYNEVKAGESWYFVDPTWYDSGSNGIYITHYGLEDKMIGKIWVSHTLEFKLGD